MRQRVIGRNEIAKLAGVSGAAVSYALSPANAYRVSKETRERIRKLVEELGYQPFFPGKTLATGKSYHVGVLLPSEHLLSSQHLMAIVRGIAGKTAKTDYNLTLFFRSDLDKCLASIESRRIDALFVVKGAYDFPTSRFLKGFPVVIVDGSCDTAGIDTICNVRSDHEGMIDNAINYFLTKSCKSVLGILEGSHDTGLDATIAGAFSSQCARSSSKFFGSIMKPSRDFSAQMRSVLKTGRRWDAFLINNECLSNLALEALEEAGQREGKDFHMIVFSTANQRFSCNSYRNKVRCKLLYVEEEQRIGEKAWEVFETIISRKGNENKYLIPYRLWESPEKPLPCHWNSEAVFVGRRPQKR